MIRVTIWNEYIHEKESPEVAAVYPNGIHSVIADFLKCDDIPVRTATLDEPECGLSAEILSQTDVLLWWGHMKHDSVPDEIVMRVKKAVYAGMGLIVLHSGHHSKIFRSLMGMFCDLSWRDNGDLERIWTVNPWHPIARGVGKFFDLPHEETYSEPFKISEPDEVIIIGWYDGGEVFRSGVTYHREAGKIFYFQPGHETYPIYYDENVRTIIRNAVRWASPAVFFPPFGDDEVEKTPPCLIRD